MASYQKYSTKTKGQLWLFKMDIGKCPKTGERKTTTRRDFKTKKEAQEAAKKLEQDIASGLMINNTYTFEDVYKQWYENHSQTIKPSTQKAIKCKFNKHILPRFGKLKIKDITKTYCQKMMNEISALIKSVNDIKIQANQVFKYAVKMDIIAKNPLEHVTIPRNKAEILNEENTDKRKYWKKEEIKEFLSVAKQEFEIGDYALFHLLIYTGVRKGEALALTWDDIDIKNRSIRLSKTLFYDKGKFIIQTSKTKESRRLISLDTQSITLLKQWRRTQLEANMVSLERSNNKLVFTRSDGSPIRLAYPNDKLNSLIKKYELYPITVHDLRHTHASLLFEAGASIKEVQERLGHSDIKMTMNIYTHVTDSLKEQTAEKFQRYIEL